MAPNTVRAHMSNILRHINDALPSVHSVLQDYQRDKANNSKANVEDVWFRLADVLSRVWDLGFTAFGGPPVHFQILHRRFVDSKKYAAWISEQTYQELFSICQALPGPGSTKMIFCLSYIHAGLIPAVACFLVWSLPGAIGMTALAVGVSQINEVLPGPVYALLSGLNASTVGVVALAAVQLASKSISDNLTRILVIAGACAGLCYSSLWYFPVLIVIGGAATMIWDVWVSRYIGKIRARRALEHRQSAPDDNIPLEDIAATAREPQRTRTPETPSVPVISGRDEPSTKSYEIALWPGLIIIFAFFVSFAAVMIIRGRVLNRTLPFDVFANMYLAGTIIFGGGPVVIPLLREYVVGPGWVSSRDFLIGLAIIQAFPGPNFNFAVYLCALAMKSAQPAYSIALGALLGWVGIFVPGLAMALGFQGIWSTLRTMPAVVCFLRGINATAVGLVFTAVYRLWEIGYLTPQSTEGISLALEPWWVVTATISFCSSRWFNVTPAIAILLGAVLGLLWYAATGHNVV
ncbi:hypothetical protein AMS68_001139 [Peltaster fructicola]|uniref:Chromate transporter n=1 Tax=Peltaster fructicola TaxID=286661 RepID=A0A6H0XLJ7_9PEZI|nr:hypothetical protein AMS68_001139 [Peltaster fructicola]